MADRIIAFLGECTLTTESTFLSFIGSAIMGNESATIGLFNVSIRLLNVSFCAKITELKKRNAVLSPIRLISIIEMLKKSELQFCKFDRLKAYRQILLPILHLINVNLH